MGRQLIRPDKQHYVFEIWNATNPRWMVRDELMSPYHAFYLRDQQTVKNIISLRCYRHGTEHLRRSRETVSIKVPGVDMWRERPFFELKELLQCHKMCFLDNFGHQWLWSTDTEFRCGYEPTYVANITSEQGFVIRVSSLVFEEQK